MSFAGAAVTAETVGVLSAFVRIVVVVRIAVEHEVVAAVRDEKPRTLVVVQVQPLENIVTGSFDTNAPRLVGVGQDLLHAANFQPLQVQPIALDASGLAVFFAWP